MEYVLLGLFLLLTALGVPVAFSLCLSVASILIFFMDKPLVMVTQIMYSGIDSFSFMAVPFFMLAGSFMSAGGVTTRLVQFSQALVGSFTGGFDVSTFSTVPNIKPKIGSMVATEKIFKTEYIMLQNILANRYF